MLQTKKLTTLYYRIYLLLSISLTLSHSLILCLSINIFPLSPLLSFISFIPPLSFLSFFQTQSLSVCLSLFLYFFLLYNSLNKSLLPQSIFQGNKFSPRHSRKRTPVCSKPGWGRRWLSVSSRTRWRRCRATSTAISRDASQVPRADHDHPEPLGGSG